MADHSAVRRDPISGREVIFAAGRHNRPHQHSPDRRTSEAARACPFCPGNETMLPGILWQQEGNGAWLSRAVPNRYPIVSPPAGHHEILIDTPRHYLPPGRMTVESWRGIVAAYSIRLAALSGKWRYVSLFRNVGERAGASLEHPHSQIVALARTPRQVVSRRRRLRRAYRESGHCVLCGMASTDGRSGGYPVTGTAHYAALVPEVAEVPFEVWIVPRAHSSAFALPHERDRHALADILCDVFHRMTAVLGAFEHNMILMDSEGVPQPHLHWFLRIRPVVEPAAGFELATGMSVNLSRPDSDAARLRDCGPSHEMDQTSIGV